MAGGPGEVLGEDGAAHGRSAAPVTAANIVPTLYAEAAGSAILACLLVGAGILAERFGGGNIALGSLIAALSAASGLAVLAWALSGWAVALFNPAIALALVIGGRLDIWSGLLCAAAQIAGAALGVMIAHLVTNTGLVQTASQIHSGIGVWTGEALAAALFTLAVLKARAQGPERVAVIGGIALLALALATPSLSLANPAITIARALTDSFTAIRLEEAAVICAIQLLAALAASLTLLWLSPSGDGERRKAGAASSAARHREGEAL